MNMKNLIISLVIVLFLCNLGWACSCDDAVSSDQLFYDRVAKWNHMESLPACCRKEIGDDINHEFDWKEEWNDKEKIWQPLPGVPKDHYRQHEALIYCPKCNHYLFYKMIWKQDALKDLHEWGLEVHNHLEIPEPMISYAPIAIPINNYNAKDKNNEKSHK